MVRLNDEWNQANETIGAANQCISIWNIKWIDNFLTHRGKGFFFMWLKDYLIIKWVKSVIVGWSQKSLLIVFYYFKVKKENFNKKFPKNFY